MTHDATTLAASHSPVSHGLRAVLAVVADISDVYVRTEVSDADIGAVMWLVRIQQVLVPD